MKINDKNIEILVWYQFDSKYGFSLSGLFDKELKDKQGWQHA